MAAIAKFISYDGGIAFSERAMKIQRCEEDPVIIPLDEVASVRVRRSQEDSDGFIRVDMADGIRYRLFFDADQLQDALQFKEQFDNTVSGYKEDDYTLYSHLETPVARRPAHQNTQPYRDYPKRAPRTKCGFVPVAVATVATVVIVIIIVAILTRGGKESNDPKIPPDLTGYWVQTGGNSDESYQMATISGNTIEVYWYFEVDQTTALYWAGTFDAPTVADEPYTWVSVNNKEKTNTSLFSSSDDTKNFTYKDGIISYSASMLGVTSTIQLQKTDVDAITHSEPYSTEAPATDSSGDSASSISLADVCTLISATITDPAADHRVISSDDHSLSFGFWIDGMASMIETYQSPLSDGTNFKTSFPEDWNAIVSSWSVDMYNSIKALVSRSDVPDARIIICMLDDRDQGSILLGIADGEVITDIVNGIGQ